MTQLAQIVAVPLPAAVTEKRILQYFESRRQDGIITLGLRVPLREFGVPEDIAIERDVTATIQKRRDAQNINDEISIAWSAADGGRFPAFFGRLIVWSEGYPERCNIELEGTYEPPYGIAGALFDASIGHLIAQRTAQALLDELKTAVVTMQVNA